MSYRSLKECVDDLHAAGMLARIDEPVDPCLEAAEIQRRVYAAGGPAIYYARVKGCKFPLVSNLFGTMARVEYLFRDSLEPVRRLIELKTDPRRAVREPWRYLSAARAGWNTRPKRLSSGPVMAHETTVAALPQLKSWPDDGGAFITLPQVYTEDPDRPGFARSNLGMYRVQLSGGRYEPNREVGLHYQIHRGIGVHHAAAIRRGEKLPVCVFVGGPPAMSLAAVMPLPEGLSELMFAGALGGRRPRMIRPIGGSAIHADADFCIVGHVDPTRRLPEGPFGDHLGYYSLAHEFPVIEVEKVYHRPGAIWPFTTVGRPPQEDTVLGQFIHELTGSIIPTVLPGVSAVHAVDATGVHPLLLAVGGERYTPYAPRRRPQELLTEANAILGQGQLSLAKYLLIVAGEDCPRIDIRDIAAFVGHLLERFDPERDLHFQTCTTIDTLDYSGGGLNQGSKLVIAAVGKKRRDLPTSVDAGLVLPDGFRDARIALPGVLIVEGPACGGESDKATERFCRKYDRHAAINRFPLIVIVDDAEFTGRNLRNFLWVTFTRSDPAADVEGIESFSKQKHWGCRGSVVIDARRKPHHAPPLVEDPEVSRRVDQLAQSGGPLHGII